MQSEFKKVHRAGWMLVTIAMIAWLAAILVLAILLTRGFRTGRMTLLLYSHVLSVSAGYSAVFLTGAFGICYVICRQFLLPSEPRDQALRRAAVLFTRISAVLVAVGFILGMVWSNQNLGRLFGSDPREIGAICILAWLGIEMLVQRFHWTSDLVTMLMAIAGNIIVSLGWFGAVILVAGPQSYGMGSHLPLAICIGIHFLCLLIPAIPRKAFC